MNTYEIIAAAPKFRRLRTVAVLAAAATVGAGCTTAVTSQKLDGAVEPAGIVYSLPMLQYDLDVTWTVVECGEEPKVDVNAEVTVLSSPDPSATYVLDYTSLSNPTKVSELTVELADNGLIKTINASADDRTAEVIQGVFSIVGGVARTLVGAPVPAAAVAPQAKPSVEICTEDTKKDVAALAMHDGILDEKTKAVAAATKNSERLTLLVKSMKEPTDALLRQLEEAEMALATAKDSLAEEQAYRAPILARVSQKQNKVWPENGNWPVKNAAVSVPEKAVNRWFVSVPDELRKQLSLQLELGSLTSSVAVSGDFSENQGIYYRHPAPVRFRACRLGQCDDGGSIVVKEAFGQAPQAGPVVLLPFDNGPFQNNSLEVEFTAAGQPSKVEYKELRATAQAAVETGAKIAEQLPGLREQLMNAELAKLTRKTQLLEQQKKLADARRALEPAPTAELEAQTALINAETALINARIARDEAQAKLDAAGRN